MHEEQVRVELSGINNRLEKMIQEQQQTNMLLSAIHDKMVEE